MCVPRHSLVLRCVCGCGRRSDCRRGSSHQLLALDMFRLRAMVCFGGCFCMRTVGACNFMGLASFCTFFWSRSLKVFWTVCQHEAARLPDVGNRQEQVQTMLEDALADIGPTLGLPCVIRCACGITTGVLKVRTVVCLMFASFRNNCLSKVGWTRATHALHRSSFSVQLFRGIVFPRFFNRICVCPGCSPISSGGLIPAEKFAAAPSHVWQHVVRNA